jgi:hypothetical protein
MMTVPVMAMATTVICMCCSVRSRDKVFFFFSPPHRQSFLCSAALKLQGAKQFWVRISDWNAA